MAHDLSNDQVRLLHIRAQRLTAPRPRSKPNVAQVVRDVCGVQAQDAAAAALSIRARRAGLVEADVGHALVAERSILRTWCMRGTLHFVASEDVRWMLKLFGPIFIRATRGRRAQLGLNNDVAKRGVRALRSVLAKHGPLTRAEIVGQLASHGVRLEGQARPHLLALAALQGEICHGPPRGREPTYVLLKDWIDSGDELTTKQALVECAQRYLSAYAPATPEDFAAWSGLSLTDARTAWKEIAGKLIEVKHGDSPVWMLKTQTKWLKQIATHSLTVRLLPAFDTCLLGYHSRDLILDKKHAKRIFPGGGILYPSLLVDGRIVARWKVKRYTNHSEIIIEPFEDLKTDVQRELEADVKDLAHFLSVEATLKVMRSH
jgi:uncharacterized protein YcaQ